MTGKTGDRATRTTRVRGLAPWSPRRNTVELLDQVRGVLDEYRAQEAAEKRTAAQRRAA